MITITPQIVITVILKYCYSYAAKERVRPQEPWHGRTRTQMIVRIVGRKITVGSTGRGLVNSARCTRPACPAIIKPVNSLTS